MRSIIIVISLLVIFTTTSCTKDNSNKFIGTWVKTNESSDLEIPISLIISKSGKNFIIKIIVAGQATDSVKTEIPATYDKQNDKLTTSHGEIIYKPATKTILTNEGLEFRKQN